MKFSETVKTLLTFPVCDTAVAVPLQPIVNCYSTFLPPNTEFGHSSKIAVTTPVGVKF